MDVSKLRCINCRISVQRLRRHHVYSMPCLLQDRLTKWIDSDLPLLEHSVCHPCFNLLNLDNAENERLYGHKMVCFGCGASVKDIRHSAIQLDNPLLSIILPWDNERSNSKITTYYACRKCETRAKRQLIKNNARDCKEDESETRSTIRSQSPPPITPALLSTNSPNNNIPSNSLVFQSTSDSEDNKAEVRALIESQSSQPALPIASPLSESPKRTTQNHERQSKRLSRQRISDKTEDDKSEARALIARQSPEPVSPETPPSQLETPREDPNVINLPNYRRTSNTAAHCVFYGCTNKGYHPIPAYIKRIMIQDHNLYIPRNCRVCKDHRHKNDWQLLLENAITFSTFTAAQIEDLINLAKPKSEMFDFERVTEMPNQVCHYWTGLTVVQFLNLLNTIPKIGCKNPKRALAIYLVKLKRFHTNYQLSTLFGLPKTTLTSRMAKAKACVEEYLVSQNPTLSSIKHVDIVNHFT